MTPRLLTVGLEANIKSDSPQVFETKDNKIITSVLSEFKSKTLEEIQVLMFLRHTWSLANGSDSSGFMDKYSCVSSAIYDVILDNISQEKHI